MVAPSEKLARSLEALKDLQDRDFVAIRSSDLRRIDRERLVANGFLQAVIKGWYVPSRPVRTKLPAKAPRGMPLFGISAPRI